jgi:hypothetical protein
MSNFFGKKLPVELLLDMPNSFVGRLRDIRYEQMMEEKRQNDMYIQNSTKNLQHAQNTMPKMSESDLEDLIDDMV